MEKVFGKYMNAWFVIVLMFSTIMIYKNTFISTPLIDYTYQMENAYRIYCGQIPYRDFFLVLTPGTYYLMALFMRIFDLSNLGMTVLVIIDHAIRLTLAYGIFRKLTNKKLLLSILLLLCALSDAVTYPYPLYNSFFTTFMLLYIWYDIYCIKERSEFFFLILAGYLATIPFLFKQNYGLFLGLAIYIVWVYRALKAKSLKKFVYPFIGTFISVVLFLVYLYCNKITLYDFLYPTFLFSAKSKNVFGIYASVIKGMGKSSTIELCILTIVIPFVIKTTKLCEKLQNILCVAAIFILWGIVPYVSVYFSINDNAWYLLCFCYAYIWFNECFLGKNIISRKSFFILAFFCLMAGYCSHGIVGSTYILGIMIIPLAEYYDVKIYKYSIYTILVCMLLFNINNTFHIQYPWVDEKGKTECITDKENVLYGIGLKGGWLTEFEKLLSYINIQIGEKSFVEFPCEDPVYWASNTKPQLYFFQMLPSTCPLSADETIELIVDNEIEYVIVKTRCQFKQYIVNAENVNEYIEKFESSNYKIKQKFDTYTILQKND